MNSLFSVFHRDEKVHFSGDEDVWNIEAKAAGACPKWEGDSAASVTPLHNTAVSTLCSLLAYCIV